MSADAALLELLHFLRLHDYDFTAVTPKTHAIVLSRCPDRAPNLRDIMGWNRPFVETDLDPVLHSLLQRAEAVATDHHGKLRCQVRVASLCSDLFIHSAFPTEENDSVFFGPDTYRFARFLGQHEAVVRRSRVIIDMGAGSGAGAVIAARMAPCSKLVLVDVNSKALRFAKLNTAAAGLAAKFVQSDRIPEDFDLLIGNAPYLMDPSNRAYRHGGDLLGGGVSLDWISQGLQRLRAGATILLYTAAAYANGRSPMLDAITQRCRASKASLTVDEIDPDVFGDELLQPAYAEVERIAAVGIKVELARA